MKTDLVLTFPIMSDDGGLPSNWCGKPSLPLFFLNVLHILGNVDDLDVNESNLEPRSSIRIGAERILAGAEKSTTREIWQWLLLLAVVWLVTEWFIYQRRIAV